MKTLRCILWAFTFFLICLSDSIPQNNPSIDSIKTTLLNISNKDSLDNNMVFVKGGTFIFGGGIWPSANPSCQVSLHDFYIDKYEVTKKEYEDYCRETNSIPATIKEVRKAECDICPIEGVNWFAAQKYCNYYGKRLPTEAEWEYAALGGILSHGFRYSGSDNYNDVAWFGENSKSIDLINGYRGNDMIRNIKGVVEINSYLKSLKSAPTLPVGILNPNELGLYDMNGNVWEWCEDWFAKYNKTEKENPNGPIKGTKRVIRGGCVISAAENLSVKERIGADPNSSYMGNHIIGFRCVKDN